MLGGMATLVEETAIGPFIEKNFSPEFKALKRCYLCQTSIKVVFEKLLLCDENRWKTVEGQKAVLNNIVFCDIASKFPVADKYVKSFLTKYFNYLMRDGSEISDALAEISTEVATTPTSNLPNKTSFKTYIFDICNDDLRESETRDPVTISLLQSTNLGNGMTTGYKIWPCSYGMTKYFLTLAAPKLDSGLDSMGAKGGNETTSPCIQYIRDRKILEIGCGTGCIGIGLCNLPLKEQPKKLVLSDFSASVLSNMIDNVVANGHAVSSRDHYAGSVKDYFANKGEGGKTGGCSNQRNMQKKQVVVEPLIFDVRDSYTSEKDLLQISTYFDTVVACDMIYDVDLCRELMRTFNILLTQNDELNILLAMENRNADTHVEFERCLEKYQLKIIDIIEDGRNDIKPDNTYFGQNLGAISIYQLKKS